MCNADKFGDSLGQNKKVPQYWVSPKKVRNSNVKLTTWWINHDTDIPMSNGNTLGIFIIISIVIYCANLKAIVTNIPLASFTERQMPTSLYGLHFIQPLQFVVPLSFLVVGSNCKTFLLMQSPFGNTIMVRGVNWLVSKYWKKLLGVVGMSRNSSTRSSNIMSEEVKTHLYNNCVCLPMLTWFLETRPRGERAVASPFCSMDLSSAQFRKNFQQCYIQRSTQKVPDYAVSLYGFEVTTMEPELCVHNNWDADIITTLKVSYPSC